MHPEMQGRATMLALLDPSRQDVPEYSEYLAAVQREARARFAKFLEKPETLTGSCRTIVPPTTPPPPLAGDLKSAGAGTTCGRATGTVTSLTRNATFPKVTTSLAPASASVILAPFKNVPFEEPRSVTWTPLSVSTISA